MEINNINLYVMQNIKEIHLFKDNVENLNAVTLDILKPNISHYEN